MALTDNLVAYWKFDESSGGAADSVGDNTGDVTNISYSSGKINNGAVFNGSSSFIDCTRLSEIENIGAITISGWYKQTTLDQSGVFFVKNDVGGASSANFGMYSYTNGNLYLEPNAATNRGYIDYSQYMSADTWTHIVFVFNGSGSGNSGRLKIYFDGTERTLSYEGTIGTTTGNNTNNFLLGKRGNNSFYFAGSMDEIGVWTRALSSTEVSELYNSGSGLQYPFTVATSFLPQMILT